jgi:uncharacterized protein YuzE
MSSKLRNHQRVARVSRQAMIDLLDEHPLTALTPSYKHVKFEYNRESDSGYLTLAPGKTAESKQVLPGIIFDVNAAGQLIGVEFAQFSSRFAAQFKPARLRKTG